jgi:hypothetical protein
MTSKKDLWLRLKEYHFDHLVPPTFWQQIMDAFGGEDAPTKAFADKLARKLGWSTSFARRAIAEYRRFVYLGMVSPFSVTPSKVIDQVWHEHQLFTEAYRKFCAEVLGRHFDHTPELVPIDDQTAVFQAQYRDTLELYRREFDQEPPHDIWLTPKFNPDAVKKGFYEPRRKHTSSETFVYSDVPLYTFFGSGSDVAGEPGAFAGVDGGESGGAGGGASWSGSGDSSSGDSGGGSDGGGGGGSSCSSGCGGGGCGGGGN